LAVRNAREEIPVYFDPFSFAVPLPGTIGDEGCTI